MMARILLCLRAKPFASVGRKATGLTETAELHGKQTNLMENIMNFKSLVAGAALTLASAAAFAAPNLDQILPGAGNVSDKGEQSFQVIDTDGVKDDIFTIVLQKQASYTHNLGIYSFDVAQDGTVSVVESLELLNGASTSFPDNQVSVQFDLVAGTATNMNTNVVANIGSNFGFYLDVANTGATYYSHDQLNGGDERLGVYNTYGVAGNTSSFHTVIAWEDATDNDFTDLVVGLKDVVAVPEPGTLALLGLGLAGLGVARRRTKKTA